MRVRDQAFHGEVFLTMFHVKHRLSRKRPNPMAHDPMFHVKHGFAFSI